MECLISASLALCKCQFCYIPKANCSVGIERSVENVSLLNHQAAAFSSSSSTTEEKGNCCCSPAARTGNW
jgi:hypothetical protein